MPTATAKRALRDRNRTTALGYSDPLMKSCAEIIVTAVTRQGMPWTNHRDTFERMTAYYDRKKEALRAHYYRQRYGRDYLDSQR